MIGDEKGVGAGGAAAMTGTSWRGSLIPDRWNRSMQVGWHEPRAHADDRATDLALVCTGERGNKDTYEVKARRVSGREVMVYSLIYHLIHIFCILDGKLTHSHTCKPRLDMPVPAM